MNGEEYTVAGMSYETYDPARDPSGSIGIALAEARIQGDGGLEGFLSKVNRPKMLETSFAKLHAVVDSVQDRK